ncbi:hypothetical protein Trydic_g14340 [Trypoxylus dichotomus]
MDNFWIYRASDGRKTPLRRRYLTSSGSGRQVLLARSAARGDQWRGGARGDTLPLHHWATMNSLLQKHSTPGVDGLFRLCTTSRSIIEKKRTLPLRTTLAVVDGILFGFLPGFLVRYYPVIYGGIKREKIHRIGFPQVHGRDLGLRHLPLRDQDISQRSTGVAQRLEEEKKTQNRDYEFEN